MANREEVEAIMKKMDAAAEEAKTEFDKKWTGEQQAAWLKKWKDTAGYKRLCKIIASAYSS